ncbi:MAG: glycoside hydrolase family 15 protein [Actinomycetota bacterium]
MRRSGPYAEGSPFPPIAQYGFLSDRQVQALVAPSGNVEWLCMPRPDSPSMFAAMLDRSAGHFRVGPADVTVPAGRRYVPGTLVLETTWQTRTGWVVVRDALLVGPWYDDTQRAVEYQRPPDDHEAEHCLLRTIRCVNGHVELAMDCEPAPDYGRKEISWEYAGEGYMQALGQIEGSKQPLQLSTDLRMGFEGRRAHAETTLREGDQRFVALSWSDHAAPQDYAEAADRMWRTQEYWREWMNHGEFPDHAWRTYLQRSALTLKGLTYAPTGALLAASTTSLPETPGGERNWDYRYSWIRDSTFALWGLYTLGFDKEADGFFEFVADRCENGQALGVMYGVGGERELTESTLDHLSGYEGAQPVRIGNGAWNQRQHDVWGVFLDSIYLHSKSRDRVTERVWELAVSQVEAAIENWREPDRGIWEVRGEPKHFTSSKMFCWVALDRGSRLARRRGDDALKEKWGAIANEIHADICANGVDERGVFTQYYGGTALDASMLLMPLVRFLPPGDERIQATVLAIADELTVDGLVLRYRVEETDDGLSGEEGTFAICSFWLVSALSEIGEIPRARELCEKLLSFASPLQLYAEEIDSRTGRHLGNFPQAFTHLAQVNALMHLIQAEHKAKRGFSMAHQIIT